MSGTAEAAHRARPLVVAWALLLLHPDALPGQTAGHGSRVPAQQARATVPVATDSAHRTPDAEHVPVGRGLTARPRAVFDTTPGGGMRLGTSRAPLVAEFDLEAVNGKALPRTFVGGHGRVRLLGATVSLLADGSGRLLVYAAGQDPLIRPVTPPPYASVDAYRIHLGGGRPGDLVARFDAALRAADRRPLTAWPGTMNWFRLSPQEQRFGPRSLWYARMVPVWWSRRLDGRVVIESFPDLLGVRAAGVRWAGRWTGVTMDLEPDPAPSPVLAEGVRLRRVR